MFFIERLVSTTLTQALVNTGVLPERVDLGRTPAITDPPQSVLTASLSRPRHKTPLPFPSSISSLPCHIPKLLNMVRLSPFTVTLITDGRPE